MENLEIVDKTTTESLQLPEFKLLMKDLEKDFLMEDFVWWIGMLIKTTYVSLKDTVSFEMLMHSMSVCCS